MVLVRVGSGMTRQRRVTPESREILSTHLRRMRSVRRQMSEGDLAKILAMADAVYLHRTQVDEATQKARLRMFWRAVREFDADIVAHVLEQHAVTSKHPAVPADIVPDVKTMHEARTNSIELIAEILGEPDTPEPYWTD